MRKRAKKLLALLTAVTVTVTGVNVPAAQAAKVSVKASKTTLYYNGTSAQKKATVTVKNAKKKVTYSISKAGKKIVSLGKISGKKTKKFTVTAKKAGKATVTVKVGGKKVKSIKFTVKKKSTATPKPTVVPTQAPTQEPSQEPTVAPSDAPTVAPTDAPSDAPTATPSEEPVKEKSVVSKIVIKNTTALTNAKVDGAKIAAEEAYVYYDVLDQYGESMRDTVSISWTTSPNNFSVDKSAGKITINKNEAGTALADRKAFTYGEQIYVVGVHAQSGVSQSQAVTVGLTQSLDTVKYAGFIADSDKNTILENLPAAFATGSEKYSLLFKAFDQNGDEVAAVTKDDVTFTSDNPILAKIGTGANALTSVTIKGELYYGIAVEPGDYADKGGEVNITAISTKTGNRTPINVVIGDAGVLGSFEIKAPTNSVYDGFYMDLDYVAKDTAGNEIKNYETIARSTNKLTFTTTDNSTIRLSENADGTARLVWADTKYGSINDSDARLNIKDDFYNSAEISDGVARTLTVNATVIGGTGSYLIQSVEDAPVPVSVSSVDKVTTSKQSVSYLAGVCGWHGNDIVVKDQYGHTLSNYNVFQFLDQTDGYSYDKDLNTDVADATRKYGDYIYRMMITPDKADVTPGYTSGSHHGWGDCTDVNVAVGEVKEVTDVTLTWTIQKVKANKTWGDTALIENCGKKNTTSLKIVPVKTVASSLEISGLDSTYFVDDTNITQKMDQGNVDIIQTGDSAGGRDTTCSVVGTYQGQSVQVDLSYLTVSTQSPIKATSGQANVGADSFNIDALNFTDISDTTGGKVCGLVYTDFVADKDGLQNPIYKVAKTSLLIKVTDETGDVKPLTKTVKFTAESQKLTSIAFDGNNWKKNPVNTTVENINTGGVSGLDQYGHLYNVKAEWGWLKGSGVDYTIKVSDVKEATGALQHKANSLEVVGNNTKTVGFKNAEIGDSFTLTAIAADDDTITVKENVTLGADTYAYFTQSTRPDDTLCTTLGYK